MKKEGCSQLKLATPSWPLFLEEKKSKKIIEFDF
jgi:hypothetical protein